MKTVYVIFIIPVLYLAFAYGRFNYILFHAHLDEIKLQDRTAGTGPKLRYIAAGDSTAIGVGARGIQKTYSYRITEYLAAQHMVEYKNVAVIGAKTADLIDTQLAAIVDFDPDVVTISIGGNDITHFVRYPIIVKNYKIIAEQLTQKTKAKIYITDVPKFDSAYLLPWPFRQYFDSQAKAANTELLKLETDRVKFVDIHDFGWSNYPDISVTNARDQFHPSDEGYNNWTDAFLSKVGKDY